jgi:hypothetical protein
MPTKLAVLIALLASAALAHAQAPAPAEGDDDDFDEYSERPGQRSPWFVGAAIGYPDGFLQVFGRSASVGDYIGASPTRLALAGEAGRQLLAKLRASAEVLWLRAAATHAGVDASVQLLHVGAATSLFPFDRGPFVRVGVGYGRLAFDTSATGYHQAESLGGFGVVGGVGYALSLGPFDVFLRVDGSRHWTGGGRFGVDSATFWAGYLGALYF